MSNELEDFSLFDLFRMEAEEQVRVLQSGLIELEAGAASGTTLESLMRAAHSIKGAARIVGLDAIVHLTHAVEDRFVAAQHGNPLNSAEIDRVLTATDFLAQLQGVAEADAPGWIESHAAEIEAFTASFTSHSPPPEAPHPAPAPLPVPPGPLTAPVGDRLRQEAESAGEEDIFGLPGAGKSEPSRDRFVRITVERFDRVFALASETLVASRTLAAQADGFERHHRATLRALQAFENASDAAQLPALEKALRQIEREASVFAGQLADFDLAARANERLVEKMYRTILEGRLRPFIDGAAAVPRLVRDTSRELGKIVKLDIQGERTRVDRDILERLEAPISHLVTNAIDHGIETPAERVAAGKPPEARLRLFARHENGRLVISVRDDGRGIHSQQLRRRIVARGLCTTETADGLSDAELLEFLFLPGFSTREQVSSISGRGVGLNVVQSMVQEAGGSVVVQSEPGFGTVFRMTLPVTRSVIKVLRIQVEGEFYAVPLVRIDRVANLQPFVEDDLDAPTFTPLLSPTVEFFGNRLPVVQLGSLLGLANRPLPPGPLPMLLCSSGAGSSGAGNGGAGNGACAAALVVDRFVDEVELSVRRLDSRLGKIPGVSAASLDENGLPLLILDIEDILQTALGRPASTGGVPGEPSAPHILVVDDSHTVREMERRLLARAGYRVTTAQNGQEAWNLLRLNDYDLLISDVDMPQMNGIELVSRVRENPRLARMPVIILSYKDREEDRRRGLEAGADFYLTKGDFQNENFRQAVLDLIGGADAT
jgi:two-component system sensor histidine kinase and response regulator WspE